MKTRILTGLILAALLIPLLFLGEMIFYGFIGVLVLMASTEMFLMIHRNKKERPILLVISVLATLWLYFIILSLYLGLMEPAWLLLFLFIAVLGGMLMPVFDTSLTLSDIGKGYASMFYVAIAFSAISLVRSQGIDILLYMLILAMVTDMFAYFVGVAFGNHKMAPKISPKKTFEGAIGGTLIAVIIATIYAYAMNLFAMESSVALFSVLILGGIFVSFMAQLGDLVASKMKREHDIKDFSKLFPGHGGVLDRFDSSIFAALALMIVMMVVGVF